MLLNNQREEIVLVHETMAQKQKQKVFDMEDSVNQPIVVNWAESSRRSEKNLDAEKNAQKAEIIDDLNESQKPFLV